MCMCMFNMCMLVKVNEYILRAGPSSVSSVHLKQRWFTASDTHEAASFSPIKGAHVTVDWFA